MKISKKYTLHFHVEWLRDCRHKNWLCKVDGDALECFCNYCKRTLEGKLSDIEKHRNTIKTRKQRSYLVLSNKVLSQSENLVMIQEMQKEMWHFLKQNSAHL